MSKFISRNFNKYIQTAIHEWEIPGLAFSIVKGDSIAFTRGYGVCEWGKDDLVDEFTIFAIGSNTKSFTTTALAILIDEGKLNWDDHVSGILPELQFSDPWITEQLTILDLVTHRVGLERNDALWIVASKDRDEILKRVRHLELGPDFRVQPVYQNLLYLAAGQIILEITGMSWDEFLHEKIFDPLQMLNSSTSITEFHKNGNIASPHTYVDGKITALPWINVDQIGPAGTVNSTLIDMSNWLSMHIGKGQFRDSEIVSRERIEELQTPQFIVSNMDSIMRANELIDIGTHFWTYGLGWFITDYHGFKMVWHTGDMNRMSSIVGYIPEKGFGVVVLTNMDYTKLPRALLYWAFDALLVMPERDWCSEFLQVQHILWDERDLFGAQMEKSRVRGTHPPYPMETLTGTYKNPAYGEVTVSQSDGALTIFFNEAHQGRLQHWQDEVFRVTWDDPVLIKPFAHFGTDDSGVAIRLQVLNLYGSQINFERLT